MQDLEGIRRLLAQYCQLLDDLRFDEWADLFTKDTTFKAPDLLLESRDAVREWAQGRFSDPRLMGRHLILNPVIDADDHTATVVSDFIVLVPSPSGPRVAVLGRYVDNVVRESDRWRYSEHEIVFPPEWLPQPSTAAVNQLEADKGDAT